MGLMKPSFTVEAELPGGGVIRDQFTRAVARSDDYADARKITGVLNALTVAGISLDVVCEDVTCLRKLVESTRTLRDVRNFLDGPVVNGAIIDGAVRALRACGVR